MITDFFKRLDIYTVPLSFNTEKSEVRGFLFLVSILSIVIYYIYYCHDLYVSKYILSTNYVGQFKMENLINSPIIYQNLVISSSNGAESLDKDCKIEVDIFYPDYNNGYTDNFKAKNLSISDKNYSFNFEIFINSNYLINSKKFKINMYEICNDKTFKPSYYSSYNFEFDLMRSYTIVTDRKSKNYLVADPIYNKFDSLQNEGISYNRQIPRSYFTEDSLKLNLYNVHSQGVISDDITWEDTYKFNSVQVKAGFMNLKNDRTNRMTYNNGIYIIATTNIELTNNVYSYVVKHKTIISVLPEFLTMILLVIFLWKLIWQIFDYHYKYFDFFNSSIFKVKPCDEISTNNKSSINRSHIQESPTIALFDKSENFKLTIKDNFYFLFCCCNSSTSIKKTVYNRNKLHAKELFYDYTCPERNFLVNTFISDKYLNEIKDFFILTHKIDNSNNVTSTLNDNIINKISLRNPITLSSINDLNN